MKPNFATSAVYNLDNLEVMRGMDSATVHLIYAEPPNAHGGGLQNPPHASSHPAIGSGRPPATAGPPSQASR